MFQTQNFLNQYELETQSSNPDNQLIQQFDNSELIISNFSNSMENIDHDNLNRQGSQNQEDSQVICETFDFDSSKEYPNDFPFVTYHPSTFFQQHQYDFFKRILNNESDEQDSNQELIQEQSLNDENVRDQIHLNLTQIKAQMQSKRKKYITRQQQQQEQISKNNQNNQITFSNSQIEIEKEEQLEDDYNLNFEEKIQSYNSDFIVLEKFASQFKSNSQTKAF